ncbi:radical SAM/SPASM domain-containing protein [Sediminibacillus terrae]|uniref:radical SAM/SPASM domain-containing protein n=1 Tax=Sediminibacillus terrae TaxID=1562106 RepID=UPI0012960175|nr:radical SAM protein [Sediminibacillus terrae]
MFNRDSKKVNKMKELRLKPSRFNVFSNGEDHVKLFNSYTGEIVRFNGEHKDSLLKTLRTKEISYKENNRLVDFLVDNKFLVNSETDEFRKATAQKVASLNKDRTLNLIIMPNEDCNFRCVYCYESFEKQEMSNHTKKGIINYLKANLQRYDTLLISWFGGEPLISFNVIRELSKEMMKLCEEYNVSYLAGITTNGYNLTPEVFKELLSYQVVGYQITLDGTKETHDQSRIGKHGEETYETIMENLIKMKEVDNENFQVILRSNISQETFPVMYDFIDNMKTHFVEDPRFSLHFVSVLNLKGEQNANIHLCNTKELFPFYNYAQNQGFNFDFYKQNLQPGGSECYASNPNSFVIGSDGMIYKCTVAFDNPYNHVGDLKEDGEMNLYHDRLYLWLSGGENEDSSCTRCYFRPSCRGNACPLERIESNQTPCPPIKTNIKRYLDIVEEDMVYEG